MSQHNILFPLLNKFVSSQCAEKLSTFTITLVCVKLLIVKVLGYGIIVGSVAVKLPQILKIIQNDSAEGIIFVGQLFELIAVSANVAYPLALKYPFSSYGESIFIALQTATIAMLALYYNTSKTLSFLFIFVYGSIMAFLCSAHVPHALLLLLFQINVPLTATGKLSQAFMNFKNKSTGQLSAITVVLLCLGSIARIFTSIQETGDKTMIIAFSVASCCNILLCLQLFMYRHNKGKTAGKSKGTSSTTKKPVKSKKI